VIRVFQDAEAVSLAAAELFVARAAHAIASTNRFGVAISGGITPRSAFELLARPPLSNRVDWSRVHIFWVDERCVAPTDDRSNYRWAREVLLDRVSIPPKNIHRIFGEKPPSVSAEAYQTTLEQFFGTRLPRFDLMLLGLGEDGHTASLFPGAPALLESTRWVVEVVASPDGLSRVTLTIALINQACMIAFLVAGATKAAALRNVFVDSIDPLRLPAQAIRPEKGDLLWLVDRPAAALLPE